MPPLKVLHTADLHLGTHFPSLGDYGAFRAKDFNDTFGNIVQLALDKKVDLFLIAGDLFDEPRPTPTLFGMVKAKLQQLIDAQIPIVIIPGTHDNMMASDNIFIHPFFQKTILFKDPILREPKHMYLKGNDVYLYGMSYHPDISVDYLKNLKRRPEKGIHIGLLHGSVKGSPDWKIYKKDFPLNTEDLYSLNLDYCALGHYHNRIIYNQNGVLKASYPGTPEGKRFRESGPRYVHLLEFSDGRVSLTPVAVNTKTLMEKEIDLFTMPSESSLFKEIIKHGGENIIARFILKGVTEDILDIHKVQADCNPYFSYCEIIDETSVIDSQWIKRLETENSIRGFFVRKMKEKIDALESAEEQRIYRDAFKEILNEFQKRQTV